MPRRREARPLAEHYGDLVRVALMEARPTGLPHLPAQRHHRPHPLPVRPGHRHVRDIVAVENLAPSTWTRREGFMFSDGRADWIAYDGWQFRQILGRLTRVITGPLDPPRPTAPTTKGPAHRRGPFWNPYSRIRPARPGTGGDPEKWPRWENVDGIRCSVGNGAKWSAACGFAAVGEGLRASGGGTGPGASPASGPAPASDPDRQGPLPAPGDPDRRPLGRPVMITVAPADHHDRDAARDVCGACACA